MSKPSAFIVLGIFLEACYFGNFTLQMVYHFELCVLACHLAIFMSPPHLLAVPWWQASPERVLYELVLGNGEGAVSCLFESSEC